MKTIPNDLAGMINFIQEFVNDTDYAARLGELKAATLAHRDALGAHDTLDKARAHLVSAQDKESAAKTILDGAQAKADAIIKGAEAQASNVKRDADNDKEAARRLHLETQSLKDKAVREHDAREKVLQTMKAELDARQSDLNRRAASVAEQERVLAEKQKRINAALA